MADEAIEAAATLATSPVAPRSHKHPTIHDLRLRVLSGSAVMIVSSVLVGLFNLAYNFAVAHELGADRFGHASAAYTILMLLSSVTLSFQLLCSKFVARADSQAERVAIYHLLHRRSWIGGMGIGLVLASSSSAVAHYLNLPSPLLVQILAIGTVFYIPLGTRRGFMQGTYDFVPLAVNYTLEVVIKLVGAVVLISAGDGVPGVVGAISASVVVAYFVGIPRKQHASEAPLQATLRSGMGEGVQALVFFIGQVIINNLDIILVKHFFTATQAGVYAAIALIGRIVYMLTWSVVSSMFPFSAGIRSEGRGSRAVLSTALLLASGISTVFILCAAVAPSQLWPILLGKGFPAEGSHFYSSLLVLYAVTTAIYSLSVVIMTYEISRKIGNVSWLQLGFSAAIIVGIYLFHGTLQTVVNVQLVLMLVLLFTVSLPFLREIRSDSPLADLAELPDGSYGLRKICRIHENEVIADFLRGEFYQDEFKRFRKRFALLVSHPDFSNERENSLRRALLFRRRGRLWRELPADTEWWEVELTPQDISRIRVFPRNQWLRYGIPSFLLPETVERIRSRILSRSNDTFLEKLRSLSLEMKTQEESQFRSVILITLNERTPLTIIEGNHRMTAAALGVPDEVHRRFRFMCGFSPHMAECCWYQTDVSTLWRYAKNTIGYYVSHRRKIAAEITAGIECAADIDEPQSAA
jgi:O-antigen/teichoic acid export membrane protein